MRAAILTTFAAARNEPLVDAFDRLRAAFITGGFGDPALRFKLSDPPIFFESGAPATARGALGVSSVQRILNRWPQLAVFERGKDLTPRSGGLRRALVNLSDDGAVHPVDPELLRLVIAGVPNFFPCQSLSLHLSAPGFSAGPSLTGYPDRAALRRLVSAGVDIDIFHPTAAGVHLKDFTWANGRERSTTALRVVDADRETGATTQPSQSAAAVLAACGRVRKTIEILLADTPPAPAIPNGTRAELRRHDISC